MDKKMRGLNCKNVQVDEACGFIGAKGKNAARAGAYSDVWTFIALYADSKPISPFGVGKRDMYHARAFMDDLAGRLANRVQLSSDGFKARVDGTERAFGSEVDYGQIVKTYSVTNLNKDAATRYSPSEVVSIEKTVVNGALDVSRITHRKSESETHSVDAFPPSHPSDQCFQ